MGVKPFEEGSRASGMAGMRILKPNSKMKLWKSNYNKGTTLIRVWGDTYVDDNGVIKMVPHRDSEGNFGTSFFIQDAVCEGWGKDARMSFMTRIEDEEAWGGVSPADMFYNDIAGNPDFKYLTERPSKQDFAPAGAPSVNGFIKGLLLACAGKDYKEQPIWGCILRLPKSAKEAFERILEEEVEKPGPAGANDPHGWYSKYKVGDPIGFKEGKIFEFHKESALADSSDSVAINLNARSNDGSKGSGGAGFESYGCRVWPRMPKCELDPKRLHGANETFDSALRYMTGAEQMLMLEQCFGKSCRDALLYVFGGKGMLRECYEFGRSTFVPPAGKSVAMKRGLETAHDEPQEGNTAEDCPINLNADDPECPSDPDDESFTPEPQAEVEEAPEEVKTTSVPKTTTSSADDLRRRLDKANRA